MTYTRKWQTILRVAAETGVKAATRVAEAAGGEVDVVRRATHGDLARRAAMTNVRGMRGVENGGQFV